MARGRKTPQGTCRLCGKHGALSFEHVPPKSAFNDRPVVRAKFEEAMRSAPGAPLRGKTEQRGAGAFTLCRDCNSMTGSLYAPYFADWCHRGMDILRQAPGRSPRLAYPMWLSPLGVIKQILTMFFSLNAPTLQAAHPELVRFVFNRHTKGLHPRYRIFTYFAATNHLRYFGLTVASNFTTGRMTSMTEVCFPPFGYVMTLDSLPPDPRLCEITHFAWEQYGVYRQLAVRMPALPTVARLPGDYRTLAEVEATHQENQEWERTHRRVDAAPVPPVAGGLERIQRIAEQMLDRGRRFSGE